ncbi:MAG: hypothetical protein JKY93_07835 [Gammaproteobacteria bacterium]|nr:hypothetical protein [Gammaproteobacteria bacterium]
MADTKNSKATAPDLDWSQISETVRLLHLTVAQMEVAMGESDDSIAHLTDSFTVMMESEKAIRVTAESIPETEEMAQQKHLIIDICDQVGAKLEMAIVAFQFYDKLTQRLSHASSSLANLANLVQDPARLYNPAEWSALQDGIKSKYTMKEEHAMLEAVINGVDVNQVVHDYMQRIRDEAIQESDVELF